MQKLKSFIIACAIKSYSARFGRKAKINPTRRDLK